MCGGDPAVGEKVFFGRLFPACAGVILLLSAVIYDLSTFPRMCGGDPKKFNKVCYGVDFSPHVRG